ncbi:acyl-CoA dehydrogenase family protein [Brucella abortus]|nr:acyl-CoA dehydrogenase family protein [Brucella abortus]
MRLSQRFGVSVRERLVPAESRVEETNRIPDDIIEEMRAMGLFGLSIPEEYGGLGLTMEEEVLVGFELDIPHQPFAPSLVPIMASALEGIIADGTDDQKKYWLPRLASGG